MKTFTNTFRERTEQTDITKRIMSIYAYDNLKSSMKLIPYIFIAVTIFSEVSSISTTPII